MDQAQARFFYTGSTKLSDLIAVACAWSACWYVRFYSSWIPVTKGLPAVEKYTVLSVPIAVVFSIVFHITGTYQADRIEFGFRALRKLIQGCILGTLVAIACMYFASTVSYSRLFLLMFTGAAIIATLLGRTAVHFAWLWIRRRFVHYTRMVLVGQNSLLPMYVRLTNARGLYRTDWVGRFGQREVTDPTLAAIPWIDGEASIVRHLRSLRPDKIVLAFCSDEQDIQARVLEKLSQELVDVRLLPDFGEYSTFAYSAEQEFGVPLLVFNQTPLGVSDRALKRLLDILGSIVFILCFCPAYFLIALAIKLSSAGPVFYRQERVGADGRRFSILKFRSMRIDAEEATGAVWATKDDDRTTWLGKLLRRTSLDETPQFFNVLFGQMSLVGPRPERPVFVEKFRNEVPKYMLRHKMKSGITGWAQINGWRGNTSIDERIKHDLYYIRHWSHLFDIKIIIMTLVHGFFNKNAY